MKLSAKEVELAHKIGEYYHSKYKSEAEVEIAKARITQLILVGDTLLIETKRPGILIGRRGENIEALTKFLGVKIHLREFEGYDVEDEIIRGIPYECEYEDYNYGYGDSYDIGEPGIL